MINGAENIKVELSALPKFPSSTEKNNTEHLSYNHNLLSDAGICTMKGDLTGENDFTIAGRLGNLLYYWNGEGLVKCSNW